MDSIVLRLIPKSKSVEISIDQGPPVTVVRDVMGSLSFSGNTLSVPLKLRQAIHQLCYELLTHHSPE